MDHQASEKILWEKNLGFHVTRNAQNFPKQIYLTLQSRLRRVAVKFRRRRCANNHWSREIRHQSEEERVQKEDPLTHANIALADMKPREKNQRSAHKSVQTGDWGNRNRGKIESGAK